jgi:hypothetical protein
MWRHSRVSSERSSAVHSPHLLLFDEGETRYLGNEALRLENTGYVVPFAYEEAIGYMCAPAVKDKDGVSPMFSVIYPLAQHIFTVCVTRQISALAIFAEMAAALANKGKSLSAQLEALYDKSAMSLLSFTRCPFNRAR